MTKLLDILSQHLGEEDVQRISRQIGADESNVKTAIAAARPMATAFSSTSSAGSGRRSNGA